MTKPSRQNFTAEKGQFANAKKLRKAAKGAENFKQVLENLGLRTQGSYYKQLRVAFDKFSIPLPVQEVLKQEQTPLTLKSNLKKALAASSSLYEALDFLELERTEKNCELFALSCYIHNTPPLFGANTFSDNQTFANLTKVIEGKTSVVQVLKILGLSSSGKNYKNFMKACAEQSIDITHIMKNTSDSLEDLLCQANSSQKEKWKALEDIDQVKEIAQKATSYTAVGEALGWKNVYPEDKKIIKCFLVKYGLAISSKDKPSPVSVTEKEITDAVEGAHSVSDVLRNLGIPSSQRTSLLKLAEKHGIEMPTLSQSEQGKLESQVRKENYFWGHPDELLVKNSRSSTDSIKRLILRYNLIPYKCQVCGLEPVWEGKPLTLTLDHISGDFTDNRLENLRFICLNCDSQTETFSRRGKRYKI